MDLKSSLSTYATASISFGVAVEATRPTYTQQNTVPFPPTMISARRYIIDLVIKQILLTMRTKISWQGSVN